MASISTRVSGGSRNNIGTNVAGGNLISPTVDPTFAALMQQIQGSISGAQGQQQSLQNIVSQGAQSPLLEAVLGPALQRLLAPQAAQQQQLTDATRAAGGLRDSSYGSNMTQLLNQQGLQNNDLISTIIAKTLGTLVPGQLHENRQAYDPATALMQLLGLDKPSFVGDQPISSGGGGGGGGGGSLSGSGGLESFFNDLGSNLSLPTNPSYAPYKPPAGSYSLYDRPQTAIDPLTNYLLGGGGGGYGGQVYQNAPNVWSSAPGVTPQPYDPYHLTEGEF